MAEENSYAQEAQLAHEAQLRVPNTRREHISSRKMANALEQFNAEITDIIKVLRTNETRLIPLTQVTLHVVVRSIGLVMELGG